MATHGFIGRASTNPPTPLRCAECGTLRGDFSSWQEVYVDLVKLKAKAGGSETRAYRVRDNFDALEEFFGFVFLVAGFGEFCELGEKRGVWVGEVEAGLSLHAELQFG